MPEDARIANNQCIRRHVSSETWYPCAMALPDLNLLVTLDVLLSEGSVVRAVRRAARTASSSAMNKWSRPVS